MTSVRWAQTLTRLAALTAALLIGADDAEVRLVDGWSFAANSGGASMSLASMSLASMSLASMSFASLSLVTAAAAETAVTGQAPIGPTTAQPGSQTYPGGSLTGLFRSGGLLGGFAAGFLGSGVLGLLFGRGLFGDLHGVASYFGLLCQFALLFALCWLIWTRWQGGDAAEVGARSPRQLADAYLRSRDDLHFDGRDSAATDAVFESEEKNSTRSSAVTESGSERG